MFKEWLLPLLFAAYTLSSVGGMVLVKYALPTFKAAWAQHQAYGWPGLLVAIGASMYVLSFTLWMVILSRAPLSIAYPIAMGLTLSMSTLAAVFVLKEHLSGAGIGGIVLIFIGLVLLTRN